MNNEKINKTVYVGMILLPELLLIFLRQIWKKNLNLFIVERGISPPLIPTPFFASLKKTLKKWFSNPIPISFYKPDRYRSNSTKKTKISGG